jgi:hypothetical protein
VGVKTVKLYDIVMKRKRPSKSRETVPLSRIRAGNEFKIVDGSDRKRNRQKSWLDDGG